MPEGLEPEPIGDAGETKIPMDQYYMDECDQYAEGMFFFWYKIVKIRTVRSNFNDLLCSKNISFCIGERVSK